MHEEPFLVPACPQLVLFLGSFVTVGESPSSVVQGTYCKCLDSRSWSQLSQEGHRAFLRGSISILASLETVLGHLAAGSPWLEASS